MKTAQAWRLRMKDMQILPASRQRAHLKKPTWIIVLVSLVCMFLVCAYVYPPRNSSACYVFSSSSCKAFADWLPPAPARELTDEEVASRVVIRDILNTPPALTKMRKIAFMFLSPGPLPFEKLWDRFFQVIYIYICVCVCVCVCVCARELTDEEVASRVVIRDIFNTPPALTKMPKIAFMFLSPGPLPFEKLWDRFFQGHESRFSVYVHASKEKPVHSSRFFINREIRSDKVVWGKISMVDAERRLLANALKDPDNQHFVLLSDSCVPLRDFDYVYNYLMYTNVSFIDKFRDLGPHGSGRYSEHMLPEVEKKDFHKGAQWFTMKRQHALIIMADSLYYSLFREFCKPNMEGDRNCYSDEHYLPTFFHMLDPAGIANWSVTHVDWSEGKWHPKSYKAEDVSSELVRNITSIIESVHVTSDERKEIQIQPCMWNGERRPCYLFARKFLPETLDNLMLLFSNYTSI